jgi:hypothetical protein
MFERDDGSFIWQSASHQAQQSAKQSGKEPFEPA